MSRLRAQDSTRHGRSRIDVLVLDAPSGVTTSPPTRREHEPVSPASGPQREDLFVRLARTLVFVGMVLLPLLRFRVGHLFDVSDAIFLLGAVSLLLSRRPATPAPRAPAWYFGAFVFVLAGVVASSQAVSIGASLEVVVNTIFVFFVLAWSLRQVLDTTHRIQIAMICFVLGSTASAFVAFLQTEFHVLGYNHAASLEGSRAVGLSDQPNIAAVAFALALVFAIALLVEQGCDTTCTWPCAWRFRQRIDFQRQCLGHCQHAGRLLRALIRRGFKIRTWLGVIAALAVVYLAAVWDPNPVEPAST